MRVFPLPPVCFGAGGLAAAWGRGAGFPPGFLALRGTERARTGPFTGGGRSPAAPRVLGEVEQPTESRVPAAAAAAAPAASAQAAPGTRRLLSSASSVGSRIGHGAASRCRGRARHPLRGGCGDTPRPAPGRGGWSRCLRARPAVAERSRDAALAPEQVRAGGK